MQTLIISAMVAVLSIEYLAFKGWVAELFTYAPELLALLATVIVMIAGPRSRFQYVRSVYWLVFGALSLVVVCGAVVNHLDSGPVFAGLRTYLRALPFFFLPAVFEIKERHLRVQLLVLLAFGLLQLPLAWEQRTSDMRQYSIKIAVAHTRIYKSHFSISNYFFGSDGRAPPLSRNRDHCRIP